MSTERAKEYRTSDARICVISNINKDRETYNALFECLGRNGFKIQRQPGVARCISKDFHHAQKDDLQVLLRIYPIGFEIEFYQNVVHDNPNGGQYDFCKVSKMPYLIRLSYQLMQKKMLVLLENRGFACADKPEFSNEFEYAKNTYFRKQYATPSTCKDIDGCLLEDGMMRWTRTRDGRLFYGQIFWDGNDNWNVVANSQTRYCCACWELFSYDPNKHPRKQSPKRTVKLKTLMQRAINAQDFERAIILRDILKREAA